MDGYANNLATIAIGAIGADGRTTYYSEPCSATMAVTFSSSGGGQSAVATVDIHHGCTRSHGGTSAASPMAAGIVALTLEANPTIGWRDLQHIIVHSTFQNDALSPGWRINGAGHPVHDMYGFGSLNGGKMADLAAKWRVSDPQLK